MTPSRTGHPTLRALGLATLLVGAGVTHFRRPQVYEGIVPHSLGGEPRNWVLVSGAAELGLGAAVALPATRRLGGLGAALLFLAVFPANVTMAIDAWGARAKRPGYAAVALARLPLQVPLLVWALRVAGVSRS